jgi:large subunit ribosomal protein L29
MPLLRIKEITSMSAEDRTKKLVELRAELSRLRTMTHAGGAVENPTRIHELRKAIAQILTVENQEKKKSSKKPEKPEPAAEQKKDTTPKAKKEKASK